MRKKRTVFVGFFIMLCLGAVYSWSVFRKPLEAELGIGAFESGLPFTLLLVMYAVSMFFSGKLVGKHKHFKLVLIGALLVGSGWVLSGIFLNIWAIILFYGVFVGGGIGIAYSVALAAVVERFEKNRGVAMGLVLTGFGISAIATAPILRYLIEKYGLQFTFKISGVIFFIIVALLGYILKNRHDLEELEVHKANLPERGTAKIIKTLGFIPLWARYFMGVLAGLTAIAITSPVAQESAGLTPQSAGYAVGMFALFNGLGRPVFGFLTDKIGFGKSATINYSLIIAASCLVFFISEGREAAFYLSFSMLWFSMGGWLAMAPAATAKLFGSLLYREAYGVVFTAYGFAAITGILLSGVIRDIMGSYKYMFIFIIAASVIGLLLCVARRKQDGKIYIAK